MMLFTKKRPGSRRESHAGGRFELRITQWFGLFLLLSFTATIAFKLLHDLRTAYSSNSGPGKYKGASALTLKELYGREKWPAKTNGPSQIFILSYPYCGAPMLTRLLMLMGAFAGFGTELALGECKGFFCSAYNPSCSYIPRQSPFGTYGRPPTANAAEPIHQFNGFLFKLPVGGSFQRSPCFFIANPTTHGSCSCQPRPPASPQLHL
jgi:hypothetical protein